MATDWLIYYMTRPLGLAVIVLVIAAPFLIWRVVLGGAAKYVGYRPLAAAYVLALLGLLLMNFVYSNIEFSSRVSSGALLEAERWNHVPGWSLYISIISLIFVLPLLGLVATPASAFLLKRGIFSIKATSTAAVIIWFVLVLCMWLFPSNEWHRTHRLESLLASITSVGSGLLFVALPFCLGIFCMSRRRKCRET
jgi:hypothetical protein